MRNEGTDRAEWASAPAAGHLTPGDVQQKQFRTARMGGGYRMREVDEFLDQVTDTLSSLIAENERLRRGHAGEPSAASTQSSPISAGDRAAIEAFLRREKAFLQSLGGLVQGHAEELKGMVRSARPPAAVAATPAAAVPVAAPPAVEPPAEPPAAATGIETPIAATDDAPLEAAEPSPPDGTDDDRSVEVSHLEGEETGAIPVAEAENEAETEEPIRLDEPEPARSRRTEEGSAGSLRELFWGEE